MVPPRPGRATNHHANAQEETTMSVAKVIEITASSPKSFEDAVAVGIARADDSLDEVQGAWIKEQKVKVEKGKVVEYRVTMKVTFLLKDKK
jgi:flavin-binding protein dodecin